MKQRAFLPDGDYSFGTELPFLADSPQCVAQAVMTRLRLATNEWFLDLSDGTPYDGSILGHNTGGTRDLAIRARILGTPSVKQISQYVSFVNDQRDMTVVCAIDTDFGRVALTTNITV